MKGSGGWEIIFHFFTLALSCPISDGCTKGGVRLGTCSSEATWRLWDLSTHKRLPKAVGSDLRLTDQIRSLRALRAASLPRSHHPSACSQPGRRKKQFHPSPWEKHHLYSARSGRSSCGSATRVFIIYTISSCNRPLDKPMLRGCLELEGMG